MLDHSTTSHTVRADCIRVSAGSRVGRRSCNRTRVQCSYYRALTRMPSIRRILVRIVMGPPGTKHGTQQCSPIRLDTLDAQQSGQIAVRQPAPHTNTHKSTQRRRYGGCGGPDPLKIRRSHSMFRPPPLECHILSFKPVIVVV